MKRPASYVKPRLSPSRRDYALIFFGALAIRCLYVASLTAAPSFAHLQTEAKHYAEWASLIASGHAPLPPFEQAPGYPYFCSVVSALFGRSTTALAYVQALLGALTCVAIGKIASDLRGARARRVAGAIASAYGPLIYFTGEVLPETLFVALCTVAVALTTSADRPAGGETAPRTWWLVGALWALAFLVRVNVLIALPIIAFDGWRRGRHAVLFRVLAPLAFVWAALVCANAIHSHRFVATVTSGGENLWLGNNAFADGVSPFPPREAESALAGVVGAASDTVDADGRMRGLALDFVAAHPAQAARLAWKKLVWTFSERELPNAADVDWQMSRSGLFRAAPVVPIGFGVVAPLAVAALFVSRGLGRRALPLAALVLVGVGSCIVFFTNGRFRVVAVPSLIVMASIALTADWRAWLRERGWIARLAAAGAVAAAVWVAWGDHYGVSHYWIPELAVNTGIWQRDDGQLDDATASFRRALAAHPADDVARINLALTLEQRGRIDEALRTYVERLREAPDDAAVRRAAEDFVQRHAREVLSLTNAPLGKAGTR